MNWYVRTTAQGTKDGKSWTNAWDISGLNAGWNSLGAGDVVWLAGGSYTSALKIGNAGGTAAAHLKVMRVRATDPVPVAAAGWNSSFDSQVVIAPANSEGIYWYNTNGSWIDIDGRVDSGIKVVKDNGAGGTYPGCVWIGGNSSPHDVFITNCELLGPFDSLTPVFSGINNYHCCVAVIPGQGGTGAVAKNITFDHCRMHGGVNIVTVLGWSGKSTDGVTFQHCWMYNNMASASAYHANLVECRDFANLTFRYNEIWNWLVEGIMPYGGVFGPLYVYGNIFRDPYVQSDGNVSRCFEPFVPYDMFCYNNTFVNVQAVGVWSGAGNSGKGVWGPNSRARNNIYYNCQGGPNPPNEDFAWASNGVGQGSSSIHNGPNPFVDLGKKDFHLTATVAANLPRNKGTAVANAGGHVFNVDRDGVTRGADGWDIGAYEYGTGGTPPIPPVNPPPEGTWVSGSAWTNVEVARQTGAFTWKFKAKASSATADAVVGMSPVVSRGFGDLGPIVRFGPDGTVDVRDGSVYSAEAVFGYAAETEYDFSVSIDLGTRTYGVTVGTTKLAEGYAFRSEQASATELDNVGISVPAAGTLTVSQMTFEGDVVVKPDKEAPVPNPMTFAQVPKALGATSVTMTATTASDVGSPPVEYHFDEVSRNPGGRDSGWQAGPTYVNEGLEAGTQYTYRVRARDKALNETGPSSTVDVETPL